MPLPDPGGCPGAPGLHATFVSRTLHPGLADLLRRAGHGAPAVSGRSSTLPSRATTVSGSAPRRRMMRKRHVHGRGQPILAPALLVVDHYGLDREWEEIVRAEFPGVAMLCIDDLTVPTSAMWWSI
ncbi:MAG: hypothetical protein HPM95_06850 [Alphaproteobacteria bacterium]|nr:hypothetical protein [Alphaproteobacteria bacterium]